MSGTGTGVDPSTLTDAFMALAQANPSSGGGFANAASAATSGASPSSPSFLSSLIPSGSTVGSFANSPLTNTFARAALQPSQPPIAELPRVGPLPFQSATAPGSSAAPLNFGGGGGGGMPPQLLRLIQMLAGGG